MSADEMRWDLSAPRRRRDDGSAWGVRTIVNGTVRFHGKTYRVDPRSNEPAYDGRLDGRRALFYTYDGTATTLADSVFLHSFGDEWPGPNCLDGKFAWERWRETPLRRDAAMTEAQAWRQIARQKQLVGQVPRLYGEASHQRGLANAMIARLKFWDDPRARYDANDHYAAMNHEDAVIAALWLALEAVSDSGGTA